MKKFIIPILAVASLLFTSCINDDDNYNDDGKKSYEVDGEFLFANAEKELVDQLTTADVNSNVFRYFTQYWAATQYRTESRYNITNRSIPDRHWNLLYANVLNNLKSANTTLAAETQPVQYSAVEWQKKQQNREAIIEILNVYVYQVLVDSFGNIPYTEALDINNKPLPKYDDASTIYTDLINRLNVAISELDSNYESISEAQDVVYGGDVAKWKLFANSLKAKLGINLADVNPTLSKQTVESAASAGAILTNANNALMAYNSFAPNYNPIYANLVASNRNDFVPASRFVDELNTLQDPRRPIYFTMRPAGDYVGGNYGYNNTLPYASSYSHVGDKIKVAGAPGVLIDASEINFIFAEAAARGYSVGGTAESFYKAGILASMSYWGVESADANAYYSQSNIDYNTAPGSWKEKIGTQAWIALYNRGFESWTFWRRLDYPLLTAPASAYPVANGQIPKRLTYPISEATVNGANYDAAGNAIGGDYLYTKLFWDVN